MNIEEAIDRLKRIIDITYTEKFKNFTFMYQDTDAIETLLTAYEKEKEKNKKAKEFIDDKNNYFEDGENWQNILKIKEILEE